MDNPFIRATAVLLPDGWHNINWTNDGSTFEADDCDIDPNGYTFLDADNDNALTAVRATAVLALRYLTEPDQRSPLATYVDEAGPEGVTRTMICNHHFQRRITRRQIDGLIRDLIATGDYETVEEPTGGRPRTIVRRTGTSS